MKELRARHVARMRGNVYGIFNLIEIIGTSNSKNETGIKY
jgi:hypothetical protein